MDVRFPADLPRQHELLKVEAEDRQVKIEVMNHIDDSTVRCISLEPTEGLSRGMRVVATRQPIRVPVGNKTLGRVFNALGETIDHKGAVRGVIRSIYRDAPLLT